MPVKTELEVDVYLRSFNLSSILLLHDQTVVPLGGS